MLKYLISVLENMLAWAYAQDDVIQARLQAQAALAAAKAKKKARARAKKLSFLACVPMYMPVQEIVMVPSSTYVDVDTTKVWRKQ